MSVTFHISHDSVKLFSKFAHYVIIQKTKRISFRQINDRGTKLVAEPDVSTFISFATLFSIRFDQDQRHLTVRKVGVFVSSGGA